MRSVRADTPDVHLTEVSRPLEYISCDLIGNRDSERAKIDKSSIRKVRLVALQLNKENYGIYRSAYFFLLKQ